jgi:predicted O-linked N-acetylglucosamine transferase (SPINDLY family)
MPDVQLDLGTISQLLAESAHAIQAGRLEKAAELLDDSAVAAILEIPDQTPAHHKTLFHLASLLSRINRDNLAEQCYLKILQAGPNAAAFNKLGCLCCSLARLTDAVYYQQKAIEVEPNRPELWANLARALMETGRVTDGISLLRKAVDAMPHNHQAHSNLLFRLHQLPNLDQHSLFQEHIRWASLHTPPSLAKTSHANIPDPDRKLHIGYVSPDFRRHSVAYFFESLLDGRDRNTVELFGYGNVEFPDPVTDRLKDKFDHYRDIYSAAPDKAAQLIEQDRIDILVDLAGHCGDNNLLVFARKPAPVQITYLGYPDTTAVQAIDYRLTDLIADPPESQQFYTEKLLYLPDGFLCYRPPDFAPPTSPLPVDRNGFVTFGSFNNSCKINPVIPKIWADILKADPTSRLMLKIKAGEDPEVARYFLSQFEQFAISPQRITIDGWKSPIQHLDTYSQIDIALDTYPYNGTTTTCEALWMGVPVITLLGNHHASRVGLSILTRLGLQFFAADSPDQYVKKALALASNRQALAQLRCSMRARIAASGLCHAKAFARQIESAFRSAWHTWCHSQSPDI